jgi:hypothetical protein
MPASSPPFAPAHICDLNKWKRYDTTLHLKSLVSGEYFAMAQSVKLSAVLCGLCDPRNPRIGSF